MKVPINGILKRVLVCVLSTTTLYICAPYSYAALTIENAQKMAVTNDLGIPQVLYQYQATKAEALSQGQLPDPVMIIGAQNLPTDTFQFDQEPMTQFKVGIRQMFPKGDTLSLKENKLNIHASSLNGIAQTRYLTVTEKVRNLWLEVLYWERAKNILKQDKALFKQLLEVTHSLYSVGNVQQQDVLRAELEMSRLRERIIKADREAESQRAQLSRWIGISASIDSWPTALPVITHPRTMPDQLVSNNFDVSARQNQQMLFEVLKEHPMLVSLQKQVDVAARDIQISKQQYDPEWGVELSYGYREGENNDGSDRSDFVSAMVNVSLPLFTSVRQDKSVQSATYRKQAQQNAYQDKLVEMVGEVQTLSRRLLQTEEQLALFNEHILSQARLQAESSLSAYQVDAAGFSEVMRAYISEQRDRLDYERLAVTRLQLISKLQFYFSTDTPDLMSLAGEPKE